MLNVEKILLEEDSPNEKNKKILIPIEINLESIEKAKKNNPNLLQENPSQDWLDWC